jgi:hypothetical protein
MPTYWVNVTRTESYLLEAKSPEEVLQTDPSEIEANGVAQSNSYDTKVDCYELEDE